MDILPAIDLLDGRCVRLLQGRYDRVIAYDDDPLDVAARFHADGARWLHVVDLQGARDGRVANLETLRCIVERTRLKVQFGGGVRDEETICAAIAAGAARVIVGTRALEDWNWFEGVMQAPELAGRVALGLDARVGKVAIHGWTRDTERTALDVVHACDRWPLAAIVYTDIGRDGLLLGPNIDAIRRVASEAEVPVIASGGVADLDDVRQLAQMDLAGMVIGRALYEGAFTLTDALRTIEPGPGGV